MGLDLCSFNTGAGSLSPAYDTPQLHDRYGGSDDNDDDNDESGYGADSYGDDILYHIKEVGVVQTELCRHQILHSNVSLPVTVGSAFIFDGSNKSLLVPWQNAINNSNVETRLLLFRPRNSHSVCTERIRKIIR